MDIFKPLHSMTDLQTQNEQLKAQLMNNTFVYELTKAMYSCADLDGILTKILLGIQDIINFDRVVLFEIDKDNFQIKPKSWVGFQEKEIAGFTITLGFEGGDITDAIFLNRHIVVSEIDKENDPFYRILHSESYLVNPLISKATKKCWEIKNCNKVNCPAYGNNNPCCWSIPGAALCVSAQSEDEKRKACFACSGFKVDGVLWMDRMRRRTPITGDDITILVAMTHQAGIILDNFRIRNALELANEEQKKANEQLKKLNHQLQVAQARIRADLDHARTIQLGLLPQDLPGSGDFSAAAKYIPADAVGGDYYDVFKISDTVYGIVVADVSGHGISSALIMSMVKALLKTHAPAQHSPQKTLEIINQTFLTEIKTDNFVTIFYAILDSSVHKLRYTSAGHCPLLFLDKKSRQCARIKADGLFLGIFSDMILKETSHSYKPGGERLVLYTDGLTEAKNDADVMFDIERLEGAALDSLEKTPKEAVQSILNVHYEFCGKKKAYEDDITLLVIDL
jgi:serine phosphatase RsbU (regulator of sigma subunit)